jgi:hypothetical protein
MEKAQSETSFQSRSPPLDQKISKRRDAKALNEDDIIDNIGCKNKNKNEKRSRSNLKTESVLLIENIDAEDDESNDDEESDDEYENVLRDILDDEDDDMCVICCLPCNSSKDNDSSESLEETSGWEVNGNEEQQLSLICIGRYLYDSLYRIYSCLYEYFSS